MNQTICAKVNPRLLTKADRLFTGSADGRIIEILQNSRRAGATQVWIINKQGFVTIRDNGSGINDFQKLLDLGSSGWDEQLEQGEDPAGVGLFCLSPRKVEIVSGNKKVVIENDGWTGDPVEITESQEPVEGTVIKFADEKPWDMELVEKHAVFAGIKVVVNGKYCHQMPFCSNNAANYETPGCRIEVVSEISKYHQRCISSWHHGKILVNFHGQVIQFYHWPAKNTFDLTILVDLNAHSDIRLMLPARTKLVENQALKKLKEAIEIEYYRYFQRQKEHSLYYDGYLRAKELGIELQEATPKYNVGLICDEYSMAVEVTTPKDFKLSDGYLYLEKDMDDEYAQANVHLLAALGTFNEKPFVPVSIQSSYMGYSWTKLPKITSVKVNAGKEKLRQAIVGCDLVCVESLSIEAETSDGKKIASGVSMAVVDESPTEKCNWYNESVCITEDAREELNCDNLWYHLGGYNDEGDSFDTQQYYAAKELDEFWNDLIGPHEQLRHKLIKRVDQHRPIFNKWHKVVINEDGSILIICKDGKTEIVKPPKAS